MDERSDAAPEGEEASTDDPVDAVLEAPADEGFWERMVPMVEMDRRDRWIEILSAVLLAIATVAIAWSAYQTARWGGEQANAFSAAGATRTESVRSSNLAQTQVSVDVGVWLEWLDAVSTGDVVRAEFIEDRMRDEFTPAFDAWVNSVPPDSGQIPSGTPFEEPSYVLEAQLEADGLQAEADALSEKAKDANQTSDNFVLLTVALASALFFAGVGSKFRSVRVRVAVLSFGFIVFVTAILFLFSLPQNVGV